MRVSGPGILWLLVFLAGLAIMLAAVLTGNSIHSEVHDLGGDAFMQQHGLAGTLKFMFFAFGYPLGLVVAAVGPLLGADGSRRGAIGFALAGLVAVSAAAVVPPLLGRELSAAFFSAGGYIMTVLILLSVWFWGRHRATLPAAARTGADLQGIGYLCFAVAAWNLCGVGSMPSFALEPEQMLTLGTRQLATGQMKAVMVLFIAAWFFTVLGYLAAGRRD